MSTMAETLVQVSSAAPAIVNERDGASRETESVKPSFSPKAVLDPKDSFSNPASVGHSAESLGEVSKSNPSPLTELVQLPSSSLTGSVEVENRIRSPTPELEHDFQPSEISSQAGPSSTNTPPAQEPPPRVSEITEAPSESESRKLEVSFSSKIRDDKSGNENNFLTNLIAVATDGSLEDRRSSTHTLRQLSKRSREDRLHIARSCKVSSLLSLLASKDPSILSDTLILLRNISLEKENLNCFEDTDLISLLIGYLMPSVTSELRGLTVEILFRMTILDTLKTLIGETDAIPLLVQIFSGLPPPPPTEPYCVLHNPPPILETKKIKFPFDTRSGSVPDVKMDPPPVPVPFSISHPSDLDPPAPLINSPHSISSSSTLSEQSRGSNSSQRVPPRSKVSSPTSPSSIKMFLGKLIRLTSFPKASKASKITSKSLPPVRSKKETIENNRLHSLPPDQISVMQRDPTPAHRLDSPVSHDHTASVAPQQSSQAEDSETTSQAPQGVKKSEISETLINAADAPAPQSISRLRSRERSLSRSRNRSFKSESLSTCTCPDGNPLSGLSLSCKTLYNLSLYRPNKFKIIDSMAIPALIAFLNHDLRSPIVEDSILLLGSLSVVLEARESIVSGDGIGLLVECLDDSTPAGKEHAVSTLLNIAKTKPYWVSMILSEATIPTLVKLSNSGTDRAREKSKKLLHILRRHTHDM